MMPSDKVWKEIQSGQEWIVDGDLKDFMPPRRSSSREWNACARRCVLSQWLITHEKDSATLE
jgi:hypothetical protein